MEGHVCKDHVHLCLAIPPKHTITDAIRELKGKVVIRMFIRYPDLRNNYRSVISGVEDIMYILIGKNEEQISQYIKD